MANLTGDEIFAAVLSDLHNISDVEDSDKLFWLNSLNQFFYRENYKNDPSRWLIEASYTPSLDITTSALPEDFETMACADGGVYLLDGNGNPTGTPISEVSFASNAQGYYLRGDNIVFKNLSGYSLKMVYLPFVAQLSATSQNTLVPVRFIDWAKEAIKQMYFESNEDSSLEYMASQKVVQALENLYKFMPRNYVLLTGDLTAGF